MVGSELHVIYIQVDGRPGSGKPKLTWKKLAENSAVSGSP